MEKAEFQKAFKNLQSRYPGSVLDKYDLKDQARICAVYFEELKSFDLNTFKLALPEIVRRIPDFFPAVGRVKLICSEVREQSLRQGSLPRPRFRPADHGCKITGRQQIEKIRRLLFEVSPYEAVHVLCQGEMHPVCPNCGIEHNPWENPIIAVLMEQYPNDTECWNSMHKGNLLCVSCERMEWPKEFLRATVGR